MSVPDQQQDRDPTEVSHPPAVAGDATDGAGGGHLVDGGVVVDVGHLGDDVADPEQRQAQPQVLRPGRDEPQHRRDRRQRPRLPAQVKHPPPGTVGSLPQHRGQQRDEYSCGGHRDPHHHRRGVVAGAGPEQRPGGDVGTEHEGGDDGREGLGSPVPHAPAEDPGPGRALFTQRGGRLGLELAHMNNLATSGSPRTRIPRDPGGLGKEVTPETDRIVHQGLPLRRWGDPRKS